MNPFPSLPPKSRQSFLSKLQKTHKELRRKEQLNMFASRPSCPYCGQQKSYQNGLNQFNQVRYKCKSCRKSFTSQTGTCFHWLHLRGKFDLYMKSMLTEGHKTLKALSQEFNISMLTAFDWRHKVLSAINCEPKEFYGLVELKNSVYPFSRKGIGVSRAAKMAPERTSTPVNLIFTADYNNNSIIAPAKIGRLKPADIAGCLKSYIDASSVVVSPVNESVKHFARMHGYAFSFFAKGDNVHNLSVEKTDRHDNHLRLLTGMKTHGVSTKYLNHYAAWSNWLCTMQTLNSIGMMKQQLLSNTMAWSGFTGREALFSRFNSKHSEEPYVKSCHRIWKSAESFFVSNN